jgi:hypothetical protein
LRPASIKWHGRNKEIESYLDIGWVCGLKHGVKQAHIFGYEPGIRAERKGGDDYSGNPGASGLFIWYSFCLLKGPFKSRKYHEHLCDLANIIKMCIAFIQLLMHRLRILNNPLLFGSGP